MQTTIKQVDPDELNPVEFELVIDATALELAPHVDNELRKQRHRVQVKGFRPGKVPISMLKKLYGESLVMGVVEKFIQDAFQDEVVEPGAHTVIGSPELTTLEYELDNDLHAVLHFGVRPEITLADLSGERILKLKHTFKDEEVETRVKALRLEHAELDEPSEERSIEAGDYVVIDMQPLDRATGLPVVGSRDEDLSFYLDDERLREPLREALLGQKAGANFRVELPADGEDADEHEEQAQPLLVGPSGEDLGAQKTDPFQVTVKSVQRRNLPELDETFIKKASNEQAATESELRAQIEKQIATMWERQSRELLEGEIVLRMLELHDIPVPSSAVDIFIASYLEDLKRRNEGRLPDGLDTDRFVEASRPEATRQARWMLLREEVIEQEKLEVTDEDMTAHYVEMAGGDEALAVSFRKYYKAAGMDKNLDQQLISKKVIDVLASRFIIEELEADAYGEALKARDANKKEEAS
ncbi:MAG: trigger factor [Rhodothermales bacterium]|nr:trigger factor [Rhodothermales bacterium]